LDFARRGNDKVYLMNAYYAYGGNLINANMDSSGLGVSRFRKNALATDLNNLYYIYSADLMKGLYFLKASNLKKPNHSIRSVFNFAVKYQSTPDMGDSYLNMAACFIGQKNYRLAAAYLDSAGKYIDLSSPSVLSRIF
jgi:hypothetical protein